MKKTLFMTFILVFLVKSILSLIMGGAFVFSDEVCVIKKAIEFANGGGLKSCTAILGVPAGDPQPLYSIILAPIYLFFRGESAYRIVLILNSLLISSLIFPLYSISKKYLKNSRNNLLLAITITFLPQVVVYEKMLLTEVLMIFLSIWMLYFYFYSLDDNNKSKLYKSISILIATMAIFTRPFGFILIISIAISEIFCNKNKKHLALLYIPLVSIFLALTIFKYMPGAIQTVKNTTRSLDNIPNFVLFIKSMSSQISSFAIVTFIIPLLLFTSNIKNLGKIRYFLVTFICLNFLISANHFYGYLIKPGDPDPGLITRYINISVIFIFLYTFIALGKKEKQHFQISNGIALLIILASFLATSFEQIKYSLNMDVSIYYDTTTSTRQNLVQLKNAIIVPLLSAYLMLGYLLFRNYMRALTMALTATLFIHTAFSILNLQQSSSVTSSVTEFFRDKNVNILFLEPTDQFPQISFDFWRLNVISDNKISHNLVLRDGITSAELEMEVLEELEASKREIDYIVSSIKFNTLKPLLATKQSGTGLMRNQYIYEK